MFAFRDFSLIYCYWIYLGNIYFVVHQQYLNGDQRIIVIVFKCDLVNSKQCIMSIIKWCAHLSKQVIN